jgi:hypothetical protein
MIARCHCITNLWRELEMHYLRQQHWMKKAKLAVPVHVSEGHNRFDDGSDAD